MLGFDTVTVLIPTLLDKFHVPSFRGLIPGCASDNAHFERQLIMVHIVGSLPPIGRPRLDFSF